MRHLHAVGLLLLPLACSGSDEAPGDTPGGSGGTTGAPAGKAGSSGVAGHAGSPAGAGGVAGDAGHAGSPAGAGGASGKAGSAGSPAGAGGASGKAGSAGSPAGAGGASGHAGGGAGGQGGAPSCVCDDPPPPTGLSACAPGKTFQAYLGGDCQTSCDAGGACVYGAIDLACPDAASPFPQATAWQVALRNGMKQRSLGDFAPNTGHVTASATDIAGASDDELYRLWIMGKKDAYWNIPRYGGALLPASLFLLANIEASSPPRTMVGRESPLQPMFLGFYFTWNHPGNPFYHDEAVLRRAFQLTSGDLMMTAYCPDHAAAPLCQNANSSGPWESVATALRNYAALGLALRSSTSISACDKAAFAVGTRDTLAALEAHPQPSPNADWIIAGVQAAAYLELAYPELQARARALSAMLLEKSCDAAGFCLHQNGTYDTSYEGWTLEHLVAGALATKDPNVRDWLRRFSRVKARLTLPDPVDKGFVGPSHFSPATSTPAAQDQGDYRTYARDIGAAMVTDEAAYFPHGGRSTYPTLPTPAQMKSSLPARMAPADDFARRCYSEALGKDVSCDDASLTIPPWQLRHYADGPVAAAMHPLAGAYATFAAAAASGAPESKLPALRTGDETTVIGAPGSEVFVIEKRAALTTIIHTGHVESAVDSGFGGGALSAVYTVATGPALLGWNLGSQNNGFGWASFLTWPTHAIRGYAGAARFSSAKLASPAITVQAGGTTTITSTGDLSKAADGSLGGAMSFVRTFVVDASGVHVTTQLTSSLSVHDVAEALPVWDGDGGAATTAVTVRVDGQGSFAPATVAGTANVREIELSRSTGKIRLLLDAPRTVRVSASITGTANGWAPRSRMLFLDVVGTTPKVLGSDTVGYRVSSP